MSKDVRISVDDDSRSVLDESLKDEILQIYDKLGPSSELKQININEIEKGQYSFFVPSYQRGYRWNKDEIITLLNDIKSVYDKKKTEDDCMYCMHPLVIRNSDKRSSQDKTTIDKWLSMNAEGDIYNILFADGNICEARSTIKSRFNSCVNSDCNKGCRDAKEYYELVDGQQRLTSVYIILWACNLLCDEVSAPKYSIFYELERGIDETFIKNAVKYTIEWFENCNDNDCKEFVVEVGNKNKKKKSYILENIKKFAAVIRGNLFFIWYRPIDVLNNTVRETGEGLFRKINKGRIELTNAELFKAMLLNCPRVADDKKEMNMIAYEWDKMEQDLHDDDFWFFICNDSFSSKTRIDYILEIYALFLVDKYQVLNIDLDKNKDRYSFYVVSRYIANVQNGIIKEEKSSILDESSEVYVWEQIKGIYDKLYTWYQDIELYHNIGFLVAVRGNCSRFIQELYNKCTGEQLSLPDTREVVKKKIYDEFKIIFDDSAKKLRRQTKQNSAKPAAIDVFNYKECKNHTKNFLLYSNIYPYIYENRGNSKKQGLKFPFRLYYGLNDNGEESRWDIEHIRPQSDEDRSVDDAVKDLVNLFVEPYDTGSAKNEYLSKDEYECLINEYAEYDSNFEKFRSILNEIEMNRNTTKNRGNENEAKLEKLKNDLECEIKELCGIDVNSNEVGFSAKNELDIGEINQIYNLVLLDRTTNRSYHDDVFLIKRKKIIERDKNSAFILPTTRKVFLNYFSKNSGGNPVWRFTDAEGYRNELKQIIDEIREWGNKQ